MIRVNHLQQSKILIDQRLQAYTEFETKSRITMKSMRRVTKTFLVGISLIAPLSARLAVAQSCSTMDELDGPTRTSITTAGQRYFAMAARGDVASLQQNSIPSLAADFGAVESRVKDHKAELDGAQATVRSAFLLDASGSAPIPHAEFLCGVFGKNGQTPTSAAFYLDNLPAGKYAVVIMDATSAKGKTTVSTMLQQAGSDWKLGNLFILPATAAGHDADWFLTRAREFKSKSQMHNAWLYYIEARNLISAMPFMYTQVTDKLYDEFQSVQPADFPGGGKTADLVAGTTTYKLMDIFPVVVSNDLYVVVKYQSANATNNNLAYQDNVTVIKAFVAKFPEVRDAFGGVVARAVDSSGHDYGTMLAMKDIK